MLERRWRKGNPSTTLVCWWECKPAQPLWKTVWRFLKKLNIELPYDPAILLLGIYLGKNSNSERYKHPYVMSTDRWMDKEDVVCTCALMHTCGRTHTHTYTNGIILSHGKQWNEAICSYMDGPRNYHTKQSKKEKDKYLTCGIWKTTQMNISVKQKQTCRHRELPLYSCQGGRRWGGKGSRVWEQQIQTTISRMDKQQGRAL